MTTLQHGSPRLTSSVFLDYHFVLHTQELLRSGSFKELLGDQNHTNVCVGRRKDLQKKETVIRCCTRPQRTRTHRYWRSRVRFKISWEISTSTPFPRLPPSRHNHTTKTHQKRHEQSTDQMHWYKRPDEGNSQQLPSFTLITLK